MKEINYWNNKENCINEAKKYNKIYNLQRKCYGCYMGLKRNGWLYEVFPSKNKPNSYWENLDNLIKEASKYKTKKDFKRYSKSAYNASIRNGYIKELEKSFIKDDNRFNNDENRNHLIYCYEINEYNTCYVGQTINLHYRDMSHRRGRKHSNGRITYGCLYTFCKEHNIEIPSPIIKENNLNAKESLIQEDYWLKNYQKNGWNTLNIAKTGEHSGSLGSRKVWTYEKCKEFCKNYKYKSELKTANYQCYFTCLSNKWFDDFDIVDKQVHSNGYWNKKENCLEIASKCENKTEFIVRWQGAYKSVVKHNWINEIDEIFKEQR